MVNRSQLQPVHRVGALALVALLGACSGSADDSGGSESDTVDAADDATTSDAENDDATTVDAENDADTGDDDVQIDDDAANAGDSAGTGDEDADVAQSDAIAVEVPLGSVAEAGDARTSIVPSPYIGLAAELSLTLDADHQIEVTARAGDHVVEVPRTAASATDHTVPIVGMRAASTYDLSVEVFAADGASVEVVDGGSFSTAEVPVWFEDHELTIDAERSSPGITIIEIDLQMPPEGAPSNQYLVGYDEAGEIVWYYANTGAVGGVEQTATGTLLNHYWPFGVREIDTIGRVVGNWRPQPADTTGDEVDDEALLESLDPDQVDFQGGAGALVGADGDTAPVPVRAAWVDLNGIHHENWPMPNGNILALSTTLHELSPEQQATFCPDDTEAFDVISDVAVEFTPDGEVLRTWDLWDVIDVDEHPGGEMCVDVGIFAGTSTRDWTHANSVTYDPVRDAVIVSSRHTNQIVAFDHLDETGGPQSQLRWILGEGATMPYEGDVTSYQHAVEVNADGSLVSYDNGNRRVDAEGASVDPPYSRAVIIDVDDSSDDPADWSAAQRWEHIDLDDDGAPVFTAFIGDADVLANGNVLITHGGVGAFPPDPADPLHVLIREVVPDDSGTGGDIVWEFRSSEVRPHTAYRSERIESFYVGDAWVPRG